jgi:hypothetical protein
MYDKPQGSNSTVFWVVAIIIIWILISSSGSSNSWDNCYDADPTQYTDMVCDY